MVASGSRHSDVPSPSGRSESRGLRALSADRRLAAATVTVTALSAAGLAGTSTDGDPYRTVTTRTQTVRIQVPSRSESGLSLCQ